MTVFKAVDRDQVFCEVRDWAAVQKQSHPEILSIGVFGSYARGDFSPGSDVDLLIIVRDSDEPRWYMRAIGFDTSSLSPPVDVFVYTEAEKGRMVKDNRWLRRVLSEIVWM